MTARTPTVRRVVAVATALAALACPPAAFATDTELTRTAASFSLDAFGGVVAWSRAVPDDEAYELVLHRNGQAVVAPGAGDSTSPISADLGRGLDGGIDAVYERCVDEECSVYRYDVESGKERRLRVTGSSGCLDGAHAVWKGRIAFVREQIPTLPEACPKPGLYVRSATGVLTRLHRRTPTDLDLRGGRILYSLTGAKRAAIHVDSIKGRTGDFRLSATRVRSADGRRRVDLLNPSFAGSHVVWHRLVRRAGGRPPTYEDRLMRARPKRGATCEAESRNFAAPPAAAIVDFAADADRIFYATQPTKDEYTLAVFEMTDPRPSFSSAAC